MIRRAEADVRNEQIDNKVRDHSLAKAPVMLVVGKRESEEGTLSIRRLGSRDQQSATLDAAMAALGDEATAPDVKRQRRRPERPAGECRPPIWRPG